ncbi:hypothetical protein WPS_31850 [Vulcanimicrobium alpinum]|uniref:Copper amine oxidase-like N-terminal domain-containing protein n=1 Tax=Vulcanimicrobium alpinum TaxID=3016050 RepID=A0AAN1XYW2_UNVUL|nr:copper amine oxidase N-terminal domain-containing protein [Vulcanimicrobium alpinum]BDE07909.1 hypothetical protein WPS_31850 [Vulcanimicrobium alpinum]
MIAATAFAVVDIVLNGKTILPHARAAVHGGRLLLPVRDLGRVLGAEVRYDARDGRVVVRRYARTAALRAREIVVDRGRAYAPLRTVAAALGFDAAYVARTRTVVLARRVEPRTQRPAATVAAAAAPTPGSGAAAAPASARDAIVTPPRSAQVNEPYPAVSARFAGSGGIDPRSVRVLVDGRDVSADAAIVGDEILYTPRAALAPGTHAVTVSALASNGTPLAASWEFADTFAFAPPPPPAPPPVRAMYVDRYVVPGTNAFDVVVLGVPGMTGFVAVDGVPGIAPLVVTGANSYVAHVVVPPGVAQPFAHVGARLTLPDGSIRVITLPQTIGLFTASASPPAHATPTSVPRAIPPGRRSMAVPTPTVTPTPVPRRALARPRPSPSPSP